MPANAHAGRGFTPFPRDITFQKALEDEREPLIDELQGALKKVVQLEGLLPICASCRKVCDDSGQIAWVNSTGGLRTTCV